MHRGGFSISQPLVFPSRPSGESRKEVKRAPAGGAIVTLASNNPNAATVPTTVTVPANATTVTFAITTKAVTAVRAVTITATYNGVAKTATLTFAYANGAVTIGCGSPRKRVLQTTTVVA